MQTTALVMNLMLVFLEAYVLLNLRNKRDILKYYTYLQNFLSLLASAVFCLCMAVSGISGRVMPEFAGGLRYIAACGLMATLFIFVVFLGAGKKVSMTEADFFPGFSPKLANLLLHYVCPLLSLVSFVLAERFVHLESGVWTALAALPSCLYWGMYACLTVSGRWEEPYCFGGDGKGEWLPYVLMPLSFIAISFVLWNLR